MKKINRNAVVNVALALSLLGAPLVLSARSTEQSYVEGYRGRSDIPVPISVVMPNVSPRYAGTIVEMMFLVTADGKLEQLSLRQPVERELAESLFDAVAQWRFAPAKVDGMPVARRVLLPLRIIDSELSNVDRALAMK